MVKEFGCSLVYINRKKDVPEINVNKGVSKQRFGYKKEYIRNYVKALEKLN